MKNPVTLELSTPSDRELSWKRVFAAPRALVFDAYTKPELIRRWLLGPPDWEMTVCTVDLRVGGAYRYAWEHTVQGKMGMGGTYREIVTPQRIVNTEAYDQAWYPGDAVGTVELFENAGKTTVTTTVLYASKEARDIVLQSPMEDGLSAGLARLEDLLNELTQ